MTEDTNYALHYAKVSGPQPNPLPPYQTPASNVTAGVRSQWWMRPSAGTWKFVPGATDIHPSLRGTRLAVVLREIADNFGHKNPELKRLAEMGLRGVGNIGTGGDVYHGIRDLLLKHSNELGVYTPEEQQRMGQLAKSYNWHRVGRGLQIDEAVGDYINSIASDRLKQNNAQMRAAHNLFGIGWDQREKPATAEARAKFLGGLISHVKKVGSGPDSVYGMSGRDINEKTVLQSLRRLGQAEEHNELLSQTRPESKVAAIDPPTPAWTGTPERPRVSPRARAGQYRRLRCEDGE